MRAATIVDIDLFKRGDEFGAVARAACGADPVPLETQETVKKAVEGVDPTARFAEVRTAVEKLLLDWPSQLDAAALSTLRRALEAAVDEADLWADVKRRGVAALPGAARAPFEGLSSWCEKHGIFVVPVGSLESWLVEHGLAASGLSGKSRWIVRALARLRELHPDATKEPWSFVKKVHSFLLASRATSSDET